jgi:hypothetical protein
MALLLPEIADPDCIHFWDPLVESSRKREWVDNRSFGKSNTRHDPTPLRSGRWGSCR